MIQNSDAIWTYQSSGDDSPLWQGAKKSFWTLPISGRRRRRITMYSRKVIEPLGFSRRGGLYRRRGNVRSGPGGAHNRGHGPALGRAPWWCGPPLAPLRLLFGSLEASVNIWTSGFCFVQFREYFLCNFFETQNSRKQGTGTVVSR
jgi:hypothetical protein